MQQHESRDGCEGSGLHTAQLRTDTLPFAGAASDGCTSPSTDMRPGAAMMSRSEHLQRQGKGAAATEALQLGTEGGGRD